MKREGRQHGLVQTHPIIPSPWNPKSNDSKNINKLNSPPTAGLFTKVSQKPTNHSKFTGKCGRPRCSSCHIHPAGKAKEKTKGTQKLRSCDFVTNYRLLTWRVVDSRPGFNFSGFSASGILDHLANDYDYDYTNDYEDEIVDNHDGDGYEEYNYGLADNDWMSNEDDHDDDDKMSFFEVGIVLKNHDVEEEGDEGWCMVEDLQDCI